MHPHDTTAVPRRKPAPAEPSVECVCQQCGKSFVAQANRVRRTGAKYCCRTCHAAAQRVPLVECVCHTCNTSFQAMAANVRRGGGKYCSPICYHQGQVKHPDPRIYKTAWARKWRADHVGEDRQRRRAYALRDRLTALAAYGNRCACCGETRPEFLSIDHVNNDGAAHRREIGSGNLPAWLRAHNYPAGFQVLCYNCNMAKAFFGSCPHSRNEIPVRTEG